MLILAAGIAAQIGASQAADDLPNYRPDTAGLGTTDCRFEIRQYVTSGQWTDEIADKACAGRLSADEERIAQFSRDQRRRAQERASAVTTTPTIEPPPNVGTVHRPHN
jgi:hypothetical protein